MMFKITGNYCNYTRELRLFTPRKTNTSTQVKLANALATEISTTVNGLNPQHG